MTSFKDIRTFVACLCLTALFVAGTARADETAPAASTATTQTDAVPAAAPAGAAPPADRETASAPQQATCSNRSQFRLILDVGHTTESPGADSARGVAEYDFNLALTRKIERQLRDVGFERTTVMITTGKARPSLAARISRANRVGADLFVSIHHDSVPQKFKSIWEYVGRKRSYSDRFKGHSIFVSHGNPERAASLMFGKLLGIELKQRGLVYTPHYKETFMGRYQRELLDSSAGVYRFDKLLVLKNTTMPAVLFEAGNIVNRDEELELLSDERRATISKAVAQAVDAFCVARIGAKPALVAHKARPEQIAIRKAKTDQTGRKATARYAKKASKSRSATLDASTVDRQ